MRPFRLRKDADRWFKALYDDKSFKIGFDAFYFCFVAGIALKRKESIPPDDTNELVAYFPDKYSSRGNLLVAMFLKRELESLGVTMEDKHEVHATIAKLVSPDAPNHLSDDGVSEFNKYAHAGFEVLVEWFADRPRTLETFLRTFKNCIDDALT